MAGVNKQVAAVVSAMKKAAKAQGFSIKQTSGWRSREKQEQLFAASATNPFPVAKPGTSQHEYGLAVDLVANPYDLQSVIASWWQSVGGYWSAADPIHFAVFDPTTWRALLSGSTKLPAEAPVVSQLVPVAQVQQPIGVSAAQIAQAVALVGKGDSSVAAALLGSPTVALTTAQSQTLAAAINQTSVTLGSAPVVSIGVGPLRAAPTNTADLPTASSILRTTNGTAARPR